MAEKKDHSKLKEISEKFSEETLQSILATLYDDQNAKVSSWDFGTAGHIGDSYMSTINKIKVTGTANGKDIEISMVVKSLPKNLARRKSFRSTDFFYNEIIFYSVIVPEFAKFLAAKGQSQLLNVPRHYASVTDGEHDFLALEDVTPLGYGRVTRQSSVNISQCKTIVKTIAKFHGISFAYKDQNKEKFQMLAHSVKEAFYRADLWDWYKRFHRNQLNIAEHALRTEYPNSTALKKFTSYKFGEWYQKNIDYCSRQDAATSVIGQGDAWAPNFLIRDVGTGEQEVLILDFQLARCASPVLDLSFFICSCTDKALRDKHFDDILATYHKELSETITSLGSDAKKLYPWDVFMKEMKEQYVHGITFATEAIPFCIMPESEAFDLDTLQGDEAIDIADIWPLPNIKSQSGRLRLADIIVDAVEKGYL